MEKDIRSLIRKYPLLEQMVELKPLLWINPQKCSFEEQKSIISFGMKEMIEASRRLERFSSFIKKAFPETEKSNGIIESPLLEIPSMKNAVGKIKKINVSGKMFLKCDNDLPISGSIKARGGIYEVLKHAEELAIQENKIKITDDYSKLYSKDMRDFFSRYHIAVGSTGNLGLSIGIISAKLGFKVTVHMSSDAKEWKKELLRSKGVEVVEYDEDYSKAVEEGRRLSAQDSMSYFVDDENSINLFMGYSVAALRLKNQFQEQGIIIDEKNPLFVYLPCGVGGGPGGVAFGLKQVFGDDVHFFFAEPTHSPCMTLGCMTETHDEYAVQDFGIDNKTIADGLAVGRASGFVGKTLERLLSGCFTVDDDQMLGYLAMMRDSENVYLEPSALAGFGILPFLQSKPFKEYIIKENIEKENICHLFWATGGAMVPREICDIDYRNGKQILGQFE